MIISLKNFDEILGLQVYDNLKMQNITSFQIIFQKKMKLFPVETSQLLFYPDGGEREKCRNQSKDEIFIVPLENLSCRKNQQKVKGKKQTVDISDGRNVNNGQQTISIIADPDHRRKQKCPRNGF